MRKCTAHLGFVGSLLMCQQLIVITCNYRSHAHLDDYCHLNCSVPCEMAFRSWLTAQSAPAMCSTERQLLSSDLPEISPALLESREGSIFKKQLYHWQAGSQCPSVLPSLAAPGESCSFHPLSPGSALCCSTPGAAHSSTSPASSSTAHPTATLEPANTIIFKSLCHVRYGMVLLPQ